MLLTGEIGARIRPCFPGALVCQESRPQTKKSGLTLCGTSSVFMCFYLPPSGSVVSPRNLKRTIDQFAPQFAGYEQHDAQELCDVESDFSKLQGFPRDYTGSDH